jgi:ribosomal protein S18 acetylase RimI-like enzyme
METVRVATMEDLAVVADTAARSLDGEAMLRWSFGETRFRDRIGRHFAYYEAENIRRGWVQVAAEGAAIAVWIPPDSRDEHETIGAAPPGEEAEILGDHIQRHRAFWEWVGAHEPSEPLRYLSHIAVAPERQAQGLGSLLLRDGLASADDEGVATWLETSRPNNAAYYERFGFRTAAEEDAPDGGPRIWFMRRDPA